ncbi:MAG: aminopeptidase N [Geminicoccaceae bacterium]
MNDVKKPTAVRLEDYTPPAYRTSAVELLFRLDPQATRVIAKLSVERAGDTEAGTPLRLSGDGPQLLGLSLDGSPVDESRYRLEGRDLVIDDPGAQFELVIETEINPQANTTLMGLYISNGVFCTQCEAEGFRRITFFQDRPDVLARYRVRIEGDKTAQPVLLSNGNLIESGDLDEGRHFAVWEDPFPKPSYLFALVAGDLAMIEDHFTTMSGRDVTLRIYSEHACIDQCDHAMISLKKSMRWDEIRYGLEYDLDIFMIVAVSDFNMGAMENKGLNIFNTSATLARQETATDSDFVSVERIIAHEYFHNWTGDRVTCRDWFQLTLKEGLTVLRDQQFTADMHSPAVKRINDVVQLRESQFIEDAGPLAHPIRPSSYIEINNFYTRTVYDKGAEVIRMIFTMIGEDAFRKGMDLYFRRHDGQAVTCEDFVAAMADASGHDLTQFLRWYNQAGTPRLTVNRHYAADTGRFMLEISQETPPTPGQPDKEPLHIPIRIGLVGRTSGKVLPMALEGENSQGSEERILELTEPVHLFTFTGLGEEPIPSLPRGFSAPVIVDMPMSRDELAHMLARDPDPFCRWEAGQKLAIEVLDELMEQHRARQPLEVDPRLPGALGAVLDLGDPDPAFTARMLGLPSRSYYAQRLPVIDVEGVIRTHDYLRRQLGKSLTGKLRQAYQANAADGPFSIETEAMARRSLRNVALAYLVRGGADRAIDLAVSQFRDADNMTDRIAALAALLDVQAPGYQEHLDSFYEQWKHEPLVVNKWFALQAMMEDDDSLGRVHRLMEHPAFNMSNPNRLRSLIGVFCMANMKGFHRADGAGYAFLGDIVADLDRRNPQVASRLLAVLGRWRRHDAGRQALMKAQLERILAIDGLSSDSFEIASKSLEG